MSNTYYILIALLAVGCNGNGSGDGSGERNEFAVSGAADFNAARMFTLDRDTYESSESDLCLEEEFQQPELNYENPGENHRVVCHIPPGNPSNEHTITIGAPAVNAHLNHGDHLGPCQSDIDQMIQDLFNNFQLSVAPVIEDSIDVEVDSARVPFEWDEATNRVWLSNSNLGTYGSTIVISYCVDNGTGSGGGSGSGGGAGEGGETGSGGGETTCTGLECGGIGGI